MKKPEWLRSVLLHASDFLSISLSHTQSLEYVSHSLSPFCLSLSLSLFLFLSLSLSRNVAYLGGLEGGGVRAGGGGDTDGGGIFEGEDGGMRRLDVMLVSRDARFEVGIEPLEHLAHAQRAVLLEILLQPSRERGHLELGEFPARAPPPISTPSEREQLAVHG